MPYINDLAEWNFYDTCTSRWNMACGVIACACHFIIFCISIQSFGFGGNEHSEILWFMLHGKPDVMILCAYFHMLKVQIYM